MSGDRGRCLDGDSPLGKEFNTGLHAIGYIFIPVAGIVASITGIMAGVTIIFTLPVGLAMVDKGDHQYRLSSSCVTCTGVLPCA